MSSTLDSSLTLPWLANRVRTAGPGAAARSGGSPEFTRVESRASRSLLDSISTLLPVLASHGATTDLNVASSLPDQVVMSLTVAVPVVPVFDEPGAQAAATTAASKATTKVRVNS